MPTYSELVRRSLSNREKGRRRRHRVRASRRRRSMQKLHAVVHKMGEERGGVVTHENA